MYHLITEEGKWKSLPIVSSKNLSRPYRLYRFLTDLEDILAETTDDIERLATICPLVVRLFQSSPWLQFPDLEPDPDLGWAVQTLYEEPSFPLTLQLVAWRAGAVSPIHNHGAWGLVALIQGQERNTCWRREPTPEYPDRLLSTQARLVSEGEIITFVPDAIHQVEVVSQHGAISLNIYGETRFDRRWEFDPKNHSAKLF